MADDEVVAEQVPPPEPPPPPAPEPPAPEPVAEPALLRVRFLRPRGVPTPHQAFGKYWSHRTEIDLPADLAREAEGTEGFTVLGPAPTPPPTRLAP